MPSTPSVGSTEPSSPVLVSDNGEVDQVVGVNTEEGIPSVKLIKKTGDKLQDAKAWIVSFDNWFNGTPNASTFLDAHEIALYKSGQYLDLYNYQFTKSSRK